MNSCETMENDFDLSIFSQELFFVIFSKLIHS
jgi:hypothetical protein